jgi:BMFP domain-containing protein YqiC
MIKGNPLFDDMAKFASSAAGSVLEMKRELEQLVQDKIELALSRYGAVTREEFEIVREMATKAREENALLKAEIEALKIKK